MEDLQHKAAQALGMCCFLLELGQVVDHPYVADHQIAVFDRQAVFIENDRAINRCFKDLRIFVQPGMVAFAETAVRLAFRLQVPDLGYQLVEVYGRTCRHWFFFILYLFNRLKIMPQT